MIPKILEFSSVDTARFGLRVARGRLESDEDVSGQLIDEIQDHQYDIEILRVPAGAQRTLRSIAQRGMVPIHADTLVYYGVNLPASISLPLDNAGVRFELATVSDVSDVARLSAEGFSQYRNHYHANPLLDSKVILAGYVEWATSNLVSRDKDLFTYIARSGDEALGFIACRLNQEKNFCEVILNTVSPRWQGRGIYTKGLMQVISAVSATGCSRLVISTQVWNYRVQQVWVRLGMSLYRAYDTYHFNNVGGLRFLSDNRSNDLTEQPQ